MNWKSWSPFQSPEVREICTHMTDAERKQIIKRSGIYGLWCAATAAIPISNAVTYPSRFTFIAAAVLCTVHIICIPVWLRWQRRFLCSTQWAREQGFRPDALKLFRFHFGETGVT